LTNAVEKVGGKSGGKIGWSTGWGRPSDLGFGPRSWGFSSTPTPPT